MTRQGWKQGLRLPDELWERLMQIKKASMGRYASDSDVLRDAVFRGLQSMEAERKTLRSSRDDDLPSSQTDD